MNGSKKKINKFYRYQNNQNINLREEAVALFNGFQKDLENDFYGDARKKIALLKKTGWNRTLWKAQSELEALEYNFDKAFDLIDKCEYYQSSRPRTIDDYKYKIATIYLMEGKFDIAYGMFIELLSSPSHRDIALKKLIHIDLLNYNYDLALKKLEKIPNLENDIQMEKVRMWIYYNLGMDIPKKLKNNNHYFYNRLTDSSDQLLVSHLKQLYLTNYNRDGYCKLFLPNLDFYALVNYVKNNIEKYNALYFNNYHRYIMQLDEVIGTVNGLDTKNIGIGTLGMGETIFSIYPVQVSKQFDNEGKSLKRTL